MYEFAMAPFSDRMLRTANDKRDEKVSPTVQEQNTFIRTGTNVSGILFAGFIRSVSYLAMPELVWCRVQSL